MWAKWRAVARSLGEGVALGEVRMRAALFGVVALALAVPAAGQEAERTPIRSVAASPEEPIEVFTRVRTVTTIRLPAGEEIVRTVAGDAENWDLTARGRELAVKPYAAGLVSNVTVSCASGAVFTFTVIEDADAVTDYVVTVEAGEEDAALGSAVAVEAGFTPAFAVAGFRERLAAYRDRRERVLFEGRQQVDRQIGRASCRERV